MKILYDHQIFGTQRFGGISRYFFELANHLASAEQGIVECRISSPLYISEYFRHAKPELKITGIAAPAIPRIGRIYSTINKLLAPLTLGDWHPDIVHETYYSPKSVAPQGSRIVLTVYDMIHELYPHYFPTRDATHKFKKIAVDRADHIICISENTQQDLIRILGVPAEKTTVVHLGFALTQDNTAKLPVKNKPFLLYVGSRGGYKNFERLLTAYASRKDLRDQYDLLAFGGGQFNAHEHDLIHRFNLSEAQVRHEGGNDEMLSALYKQAAIFVYPSLYEGFGIPPLEAMGFDCPVVCSNTSSILEVVGNAAVHFDPLEADSIADALVALSNDSALQKDLIRRGRKRVEQFSWHKCSMQTLDVYQQVLI